MSNMAQELVDITSWLKAEASNLAVGQMVKQSDLPLEAAMNSIELFNPKMDTGMASSSTSKAGSSSQGTSQPKLFDPTRDYKPEELLWIMDEMLSAEIAWYKGVNLAQSVFRCLYYYHPDKLGSNDTPELIRNVFRPWLIAYCKSIDLAYRELGAGHVNDIEDVWMDHYGIAVHLDDRVEDIDYQLEVAKQWLEEWQFVDDDNYETPEDWEYRHTIYQSLLNRFTARQKWLRQLHFSPQPSPYIEYFDPPDTEIILEPDALIFDDMTPFLRQNMPPFTITIPSHEEAGAEMRHMMESIDGLSTLGDDILSWQIATKSRTWVKRENAILRSLYKTYFYEKCQNVAGRYISLLTGLPDDTFASLQVEDKYKQQFAIWRDIVGGLCISTLSSPTMNRSRQRRSYQSLSFSWRERAAMAEKLGLTQMINPLHAIRLDCLLEGALAAFDNDLIAGYEERQAWWWIQRIAQSRVDLQMVDWGHTWSEMWSQIAKMMFTLLALNPRPGPDSKEQFELRHKWAIKIPTMWDGKKLESGLTPRYEDWCRDRDDTALVHFESIGRYGEAALEAMLRLHRSDLGRDSKDFRVVLSDLREDVCHIMTIDIKSPRKWGKRRRWIPILQ